MPHGYKRIYKNTAYLRKDHFCPDCGTKLEKIAVSKVVNSRSPEAKNYDFSMPGKVFMVGDIKFTWDELECPNCKKHLTAEEMKAIEGVDPNEKEGHEKLKVFLFYLFVVLFLLAILLIKWNT